MKACIVGSRALVLDGNVAQIVLEELLSLGDRGFTEILVREPLYSPLRPFEALVASLGSVLSLAITAYQPDVGGRAQVFLRDIEMVGDSDEVVAFFPADSEMTGGTGHIVEKALDQKRPVRAYSVANGKAVLVGSDSEDNPS